MKPIISQYYLTNTFIIYKWLTKHFFSQNDNNVTFDKGSTLYLDLKLLMSLIQRRLAIRRTFIDMINQDFTILLSI